MEPESPFHSIRERLASIDKSLCISPVRIGKGGNGRGGGDGGSSRSYSRKAVAPMPVPLNNINVNGNGNGNEYQTPMKKKYASKSSSSSNTYSTQKKQTSGRKKKSVTSSYSKSKSGSSHVRRPKSNTTASSTPKRTTSKTTESASQVHVGVDFQSVLRIRPFNEDERKGGDTQNVFHCNRRSRDGNSKNRHGCDDDGVCSANANECTSTVRMCNPLNGGNAMDYHFDSILGADCGQEETYETIGGQTMALDALNPILLGGGGVIGGNAMGLNVNSMGIEARHHVIISMGVSNSGKTFTIFGPGCDDEHSSDIGSVTTVLNKEDEGIVPRLIDDLFICGQDSDPSLRGMLIQSSNVVGDDSTEPQLELELSMVHLHNDHIFDMLTPQSKPTDVMEKRGKRPSNVSKMIESFEISGSARSSLNSLGRMDELRIFQDRQTQDFVVEPTIVHCPTSTYAREVLHRGLMQNTVKSTKLNKTSSRGHTIVTLRPVLKTGSGQISSVGGSITIMDLAGIENTKQSAVLGPSMRESVSINSSISAMMQCLRSIKANQEQVHNDNDLENVENKWKKNGTSKQLKMVPYRENKLTKLMQPLFSGSIRSPTSSNKSYHGVAPNISKMRTVVQMFISVYPGMKDFNEKKSLLQDIDSLRGLSLERTFKQSFANGEIMPSSAFSIDSTTTTRKESLSPSESQSTDLSNLTNEYKNAGPPPPPFVVDKVGGEVSLPKEKGTTPSTSRKQKTVKSPLQLLASVVNPGSGKKRKADVNERIKVLENENVILKKANDDMKRRYQALINENKRLKLLLAESEQREKEAMQKIAVSTTSHRDAKKEEENFQINRRLRRSRQNLIASPIIEHMKIVEQTKTFQSGKVGHFLQEKPPFPFEGPGQRRQRELQEQEEAELLTHPKDEQEHESNNELDLLRSDSMESASA